MNDPGRTLHRHRRAKADLVEIVAYLMERNPAAARRFLADVQKAYELILGVPTVGRLWNSPHAALKGVRYTTVSRRFRSYLIFYKAGDPGVLIVTVLHAARDLRPLLDAFADDSQDDSLGTTEE